MLKLVLKKVLKIGEMLKMFIFLGSEVKFGSSTFPQKDFNVFNISPVFSTFPKTNFNIFNIYPQFRTPF